MSYATGYILSKYSHATRDLREKKMKSFKRMTMCILVTLVFGLPALAGDGSCPPPIPGEMSAPPCSSTQLTSDDPVQAETQTTATTGAVTETITDTAIDLVVGSILSLF
jgi:hypothetical protein